jgi:hypothetical protein
MRIAVCMLVAVALVGLVLPALAGDIVDMPTANSVAPRHVETNYIHWDLSNPVYEVRSAVHGGPPRFADIYEVFVGVMDRVELDVDVADLENVKTFTEANLYLTAIRETGDHPSLIVGATNILGNDWTDGKDKISPFALSAYNIHLPEGPPTPNDPLVRLHLGWGDEYHQGWFGGVQFLFVPRFGAAAFSYQGQPAYMGTVNFGRRFELTYGTKNGDPFYRGGFNFAF